MLPESLDILCRLGDVIMTPRVRAAVSDEDLATALFRHARTAYGDCLGLPALRRDLGSSGPRGDGQHGTPSQRG